MKPLTIVLCFLCCIAPRAHAEPPIKNVKIAALNIRAFGHSKLNKTKVMNHLIKVVSSFDLILLQELRGKDNHVINTFLKKLNKKTHGYFRSVSSPPLGPNSYTEQYAYVYDSRIINVEKSWVYEDSIDSFDREPFIAQITAPGGHSFSAIGLHTSPLRARKEIKALNLVERTVVAKSKNENIIILGDLNADCAYYNDKAYSLQIFAREAHIWIENHQDTTVSASHCAYDRIISLGPISQAISSPSIYNYEKELSVSTEQAQEISDHYPVSISLNTSNESESCGEDPYLTLEHYCYATKDQRKTRMPDYCCSL